MDGVANIPKENRTLQNGLLSAEMSGAAFRVRCIRQPLCRPSKNYYRLFIAADL
jgi:hypothetical protein